jgi:transposase
MINQVAESLLLLKIESLKRLGIDEISLVKGQGKFIIVLVDLDTGKLINLKEASVRIKVVHERRTITRSITTFMGSVSSLNT